MEAPSLHGEELGAGDLSTGQSGSLYERAGGAAAFEALAVRFYEGVASDDVLRPLYPDGDLSAARERLAAFLVQLAGGARRYEALRGEPRLRLRHLRFRIGERERAAWLARMGEALHESGLPKDVSDELRTYFERTAAFLVNDGKLSLRGEAMADAGPVGERLGEASS
jgi:hemoglobin